MKAAVLKIHAKDNVLVALADLKKEAVVTFNGQEYTLLDDIPAKHKFFTQDLNAGDPIIMYGVLVGRAQQFVRRGSRMSTENTQHAVEP